MIEKVFEWLFTRDASVFKDVMFNIWDAGLVLIIIWIALCGVIAVSYLRSYS